MTSKKVNIAIHGKFNAGSPEEELVRECVPSNWCNGAGSMICGEPNRDIDWDVPINNAAQIVKKLKSLKLKMNIFVRDRKTFDDIKLKDLPGWK